MTPADLTNSEQPPHENPPPAEQQSAANDNDAPAEETAEPEAANDNAPTPSAEAM